MPLDTIKVSGGNNRRGSVRNIEITSNMLNYVSIKSREGQKCVIKVLHVW